MPSTKLAITTVLESRTPQDILNPFFSYLFANNNYFKIWGGIRGTHSFNKYISTAYYVPGTLSVLLVKQ